MPTYIVECGSCQQAWEVPTYLMTTPDRTILLPAHQMLGHEDSKPTGVPCPGRGFPGLGMGDRVEWERRWPSSHPRRPLPAVLDGSTAVKVAVSN